MQLLLLVKIFSANLGQGARKRVFRVCVCSNPRNDVPRVAQQYGIIAAPTQRRASVLVVFVVFYVQVHSFAGLIRRTPPPMLSDTAITDRHCDTTIFQLSSLGADILVYWIGNIVRTCAPGGSRLPACKASTLSTRTGSPLNRCFLYLITLY